MPLDYPQVSSRQGDISPADATGFDEPSVRDRHGAEAAPAAVTARKSTRSGKRRGAKQFWLKQLHAWHWISAAVSLIGMFLFAVTGITLNHAGSISAEPQVVSGNETLPRSLVGLLKRHAAADAPLPAQVAGEIAAVTGIEVRGRAAEWSADEAYVAVPGPGSDAWVAITLADGAIAFERTDRGWISFFNDLHKGRNAGNAWFWFIDVFAAACVVFTFTGMLLLQLHARHRRSTWPLVGLGTAIPLVIVLFFLHS